MTNYTRLIKEESQRLGFSFCGISKAGFLEEDAPRLEAWLNCRMHGEMDYMARNFDKRLDPRILVPGAKTVISLLLNYYTSNRQEDSSAPRISKYAFGKTDYHVVLKKKLNLLFDFIKNNIGDVNGRAFVDSAPVMDRAWAKKSGLGWIGKNSNLINKKMGSYVFIGELVLDIVLDYDGPIKDYCGSCTKCIDACPTGAIEEPYLVNGSKCISYFTIELKNSILSPVSSEQFGDWIFGCDICQDVCPWNRFSIENREPGFEPLQEIMKMNREEWETMSEEKFNEAFKDSPLMRTGYNGIKRNLKFIRRPASQMSAG